MSSSNIRTFQPGTPQARPYEAPTPGSGWANTPGVSFNDAPTPRDNYGIEVYLIIYSVYYCNYVFILYCLDTYSNNFFFHSDLLANAPSPYVPSTPVGQPMTPNSAAYLPGTPGGQPMTPGNVGMDIMSPIIGVLL